jgi:hypothetical protein
MPDQQLTVVDLGKAVKQKYAGAYDDLDDADLGRRVQAKFPGAYDDYAPVAAPQPVQGAQPVQPYAAQPSSVQAGGATPVRTDQIRPPYAAQPAAPRPAGNLMHPQAVETMTSQNAQAMAPAFAPPTPMDALAGAARQGINRFPAAVMSGIREGAIGRAFGLDTETAAVRRAEPGNPLFNFNAAINPPPGIVRGLSTFASGLTEPENLTLMGATAGLGEAAPVISGLVSLGFSADMLHGVYQQIPEFRAAVNRGDFPTAKEIATRMVLGTAMGGLAGIHGVRGVRGAPKAAPEEGTATITGRVPYQPPEPAAQPTPQPPAQAPAQPTQTAAAPVAPAPALKRLKGEKYSDYQKRLAAAAAAQPAQPPAQPAQPIATKAPAPTPVEPNISDQDLQRLLSIETNLPKRAALIAQAQRRGVPVPAVPRGPRVAVGKLAEGPTRTEQTLEYQKLFDEAEARAKKLPDQELQRLLKIETNPAKRAQYAQAATERGIEVPEAAPLGPRIPVTKLHEGQTPFEQQNEYGKLFDQAIARLQKLQGRRARTKPAIPEQGDAGERAKAAREDIAQWIAGKPYAAVEPEGQQIIDQWVKEGNIGAGALGQAAAKPAPAKTQIPDVAGMQHVKAAKTEPVQRPAPAASAPQSVAVQPQPTPKAKASEPLVGRMKKIRDIRQETGMNYADAARELVKREGAQPIATKAPESEFATLSAPKVKAPGAIRAAKIRELRAGGMTYKEAVAKVDAEQPAQPVAAKADEMGPHGPILRQFKGDAAGAIAELQKRKTGEAIGALTHPEINQPIDLVWGERGTASNNFDDGSGLAKIEAKHPEVLANLQSIFSRLKIDRNNSGPNRIRLYDEKHGAVVRLDFDKKAKTWLLTAYERREIDSSGSEKVPSTGRTTDVSGARATERHAPPSGGSSSIPPGQVLGKAETPEPSAAPASQKQRGDPGWIGNVPTSSLHVDPTRFQFKRNVGQGGAGEEFREVRRWDPEKAGVVAVWRDPTDGKDYVVNGHHRYEMAVRLGAPQIPVVYLDAATAAQARLKGALINIGEGRGESIDAAKVFRDTGMSIEDLENEGVSLKGKVASEGWGLSKLAQPLFDDVLNGDLPAARGALIGSMVERPQDQIALYNLLKQREANGKRLTNDQVGELIRLNNAAPTKTTSTADDAQQSMFGEEEMTRSLLPEKAEISDYVRKQLGQERKLFSTVGSEGAAQTLGAAGNVIDASKNAAIAEKANQAQMLYDKLSSGAGPIGDALDLAARRLADGEPANEVKRETYRAIRASLIEQANRLTGVSRVGSERVAVDDREGTHQVNPVRPGAPEKAVEPPQPAPSQPEDYREQIRRAEEKARAQWNVGPAAGLRSGEALEDSPLFGGPRQGGMFGEGGGGLFGDEEESDGGILGTGNPEAGALDISFLVKALDKLFPGDVAKANYSGLGAAKNIFVRNLSQLEKASPASHAAAVRAAASRSQVAVLLRSAVPEIEKVLGPDIPWKKFRTALIESRLRGIRARWEDWARQSGNKSIDGFRKGMQNGLMNILEQIEGQRGIPQDVRETALALLHNVDGKPLTDAEQMKLVENAQAAGLGGNGLTKIRQLQVFMQRTFADAARSVAHVMDPAEFDATIRHPNFAAGLKVYKDLLEKPVAENHAINEGVFSTALGPARTYYPLIPLEETQAPDISQKRPTPFAKPKNIANELATGLAPAYDVSMSALESRLSRAIKGNNKAAMFTALEDAGLLKPLDVGERASPFMEINGERYHAKTIELAEPQQRIVKGTLENVPAKFALVPDWLHKELEPIVKRGDLRTSRPRQIIDAITQTALAGPSDMVFHATNLLGTLVANTPYLGDSLGAKTVGNTLFTKLFTAAIKMATTDPMNADAVTDLMEMARAGVLPDRYGSVTYSKKFAEQTGAELKRFSPSPILYGPKGLDARARLLMWRLSKELAPNATLAERAQFTNQLGNYVSALQGPIERALKSSVAPFYTAGSAMYRNGLNAVLGTGPMPGNRFEYRVAQQLSGGMVGFVAVWALANRAMTGQWPWDDQKSKFGQLPIPDSVRRSAGGKALFGPGTDTGYVNLALFNPILTRGARALGLSGAYNERAIGGDTSRMIESAIKDMGNSVIEPATTGPIVKAGTILATGNEPYVTSVNPFRMMPATDPKKHGAAMLAERGKEAVLNMNNFFQNLGAATGFGHRADEIATKGDRWLKMVTAIALPRLFSQSDVGRQAGKVASERRLEKRGKLMDTLVHSLEQGKGIPSEVLDAYRAGELTRRDMAEAKRESRETPLQRRITHMPIGEAIDEYAAATPEQRAELREILSKKARAAMALESGAERAATLEAYRRALAAP